MYSADLPRKFEILLKLHWASFAREQNNGKTQAHLPPHFVAIILWYTYITNIHNFRSEKKNTKRSSNTSLHLVFFSSEKTLEFDFRENMRWISQLSRKILVHHSSKYFVHISSNFIFHLYPLNFIDFLVDNLIQIRKRFGFRFYWRRDECPVRDIKNRILQLSNSRIYSAAK